MVEASFFYFFIFFLLLRKVDWVCCMRDQFCKMLNKNYYSNVWFLRFKCSCSLCRWQNLKQKILLFRCNVLLSHLFQMWMWLACHNNMLKNGNN